MQRLHFRTKNLSATRPNLFCFVVSQRADRLAGVSGDTSGLAGAFFDLQELHQRGQLRWTGLLNGLPEIPARSEQRHRVRVESLLRVERARARTSPAPAFALPKTLDQT